MRNPRLAGRNFNAGPSAVNGQTYAEVGYPEEGRHLNSDLKDFGFISASELAEQPDILNLANGPAGQSKLTQRIRFASREEDFVRGRGGPNH